MMRIITLFLLTFFSLVATPSFVHGEMYVHNALDTIDCVFGEWKKVEGFTASELSGVTYDSDYLVTADSGLSQVFITTSFIKELFSLISNFKFTVAVNDSPQDEYESKNDIAFESRQFPALIARLRLQEDDSLSFVVKNVLDSDDIIVEHARMSIQRISI